MLVPDNLLNALKQQCYTFLKSQAINWLYCVYYRRSFCNFNKKFARNSVFFREFAHKFPNRREFENILVNFEISLGLRLRKIWKFPRIFKFPPGIEILSANSLKKPEYLLQIPASIYLTELAQFIYRETLVTCLL